MKRLLCCFLLLSSAAFAQSLFDVPWQDRSPFIADLRYPEVLEPLREAPVYHLELHISDDLRTVTGRQEVRITSTEKVPLDTVVFRLFPNILGSQMEVTEVVAAGMPVTPTLKQQGTVLSVPLGGVINPGESVTVELEFTLNISDDPQVGYGRLGLYENVLSLAHAYPILAVYENGAWDTSVPPSLADPLHTEMSFYLVRVNAPASQRLVASGVERSRKLVDGRQVVTFAAGPVRDFYLTSSENYQLQRVSIRDVTINSYAPPDLTAGSQQALDYAKAAMKVFGVLFGPYPYRELDIVAVPVAAGGIEFSGIFVVANNYYQRAGSYFELIVVHETAHQWFFGTVGNDQLAEPWLDESLAQYATLLYVENVHGEEAGERFIQRYFRNSWSRVGFREIPVGLPATAYTPQTYSPIVYGRGPLFFEALEQTVGEATQRTILHDYYQTYAWDIADSKDFQAVAEDICNCDLTELFEAWVYP